MANIDKSTIYAQMAQTPMIPVFYHGDCKIASQVLKACYAGGVRVFEFTNRGEQALDVFKYLRALALKEMPDLCLGVGSVVYNTAAGLFIKEGADFIVGPCYSEEVWSCCRENNIPYIPGCGTVTEMYNAMHKGCEIVKLFPGDVYGPNMVKDVLAPMPWTKIMVTGGVSPDKENLTAWFRAGAFCVGMGSKLFPRECIVNNDWQYITDKCREVFTIINEVKK